MKQYPGYTLVKREDCPEQHGTLTVLTHDVSGAAVLLVENDDDNKAFGIGFGTFPSDDTGVFHILEHSVLAGSEKYPVKSPFLQLLKSSMASFLNAMTFPDKTVYPFATPNETDFKNLMDVYLNAVFCPLAMVDKGVFEDGTVSGVVYNEMQGALATPDAQLQNALSRAMFPDTAYGFVSGGDPASIPALTYEKYVRVYRRHYSADNCCITLYGKMDMAEKLAFLDEQYLSRMPKSASRPRLTVQDEQVGVKRNIPYYTEKPEPDEAQCALAWYTGAFSDRERQLGVEILLDALLGTNQAPLKAALLEEKLGADIDVGFDDSTLQPTLELVLRGATEESAGKFAAAVRKAVGGILEKGIPEELLMASLNSTEFASLERPGSIPDGVLDAINASTGWLHTGDPALLLHALFASLREKLEQGWFNELLRELFAPAPVEIIQVPTLPKKEEEGRAARTDGKLVLDHPLTAADLGEGKKQTLGSKELLAGAELLHHPSAGNTYLYLYYDLGGMAPEDMSCLHLLTDVMDELDTEKHTAQELNTLRNTWLGSSGAWMDCWTGRQEGRPCHAKLIVGMSMLERSLEKAVELGSEWLYETKFSGPQTEAAMERVASQQKLLMEQKFLREGHAFAAMRAAAHFSVESALSERCNGVSYYHYLCELLEKADWTALGKKMEELWKNVLKKNALTVSLHGSDAALDTLKKLLPGSAFAAEKRGEAKPYTEELTAPVNEAFIIDGGVNYDVLVWPMERRLERKVLARVMSYEYLWHNIREVGGAYGTGMVTQNDDTEYLYTYRDPHLKESYETFAKGPTELAGRDYTEKDMNEFIVGAAAKLDTPRKPREEAASTDCKYFCGITDEMTAAERKSLCSVDAAALKAEAADLSARMEKGVRVVFGSKEAVEAAKELFDRVETL